MLPSFAHLPLSTAYVLASFFSCDPATPPSVTVQFQNTPLKISNTRPSAYLMDLKKDSSSPNYGGEFPKLDGLTSGTFQFKYDLDFTDTEQLMLHKACVRTKSAHIVITYMPTIYISSNAQPSTCRYNVTFEHEMRHVNTDINTINEFISYIQTHAAVAISPEHSLQPILETQIESAHDRVSNKLSQALTDATDVLQQTRTYRQRQIDTRQEYERLSKACPNENGR